MRPSLLAIAAGMVLVAAGCLWGYKAEPLLRWEGDPTPPTTADVIACSNTAVHFEVDFYPSPDDLDSYDDPNYVDDGPVTVTWTHGGASGWVPSADKKSADATWITPGTYTVKCKINDPGRLANDPDVPERVWNVVVVGGEYTADKTDLVYYCGAFAGDAGTAMLTSAQPQPDDTSYLWAVTSGPGEIIGSSTSDHCYVHATGPSVTDDDIKVKLTYSYGGHSCDYTTYGLTSHEPSYTEFVLYEDSCDSWFFESDAVYTVWDQLHDRMYGFLPAGETFLGDRVDYWLGNNWDPTRGGGGVPDFLIDEMRMEGFDWDPVPNCSSPDSVFGQTQYLWVGSSACDGTGCLVKIVWQHFYRNRGRHE